MVFRITVDGIEHTTETDRDIHYAIIGRVPVPKSGSGPGPGSNVVEDSESGLGRRIDPGADATSGTGKTDPSFHLRQVLGWCATRDEAEVSLQKLFREKLFSNLEIVPVPGK